MRGIVALIDSVAFQTNILALNAAIEAARRRSWPRFAIVAKEVGLLAQKSSHSTRDIQQLINRSLQQIDQGSQAVELLTGNLRQIIDLVNKCSALMGTFPGIAQSGENSGRDGAHLGAESGGAANRHGGERGDRGFAAVAGRVGTVRKSDGAFQAAGAINTSDAG